jgi:phosphohistidine swiveling domain-containing protein
LPDILLAKVIEHNDGKLLSCAAIIAKALHLPVFEAKKAIEALEE